ncbi:uncharacterized protein [Misgurnus anguillicaudatus]|uniref:uncharacterized protein n=1 Tax=Misgurnus anguillicaudatus TaxID=75329 RepID=UPI003CCFCB71
MQGRTEEDIQATVLQAKKEMAEFSHKGRFWDYHRILEIFGAANPLASLLEEMKKKGLVVRNIPPILHTPASFTHSTTRDAEREPPAVEPEEPEPASDENSEEYYQSNGPRWTDDVRVEMVKKGLYKKHSIKHHLLDGFFHYLRVDLGNRKCKQEVENVSRFMYFMNSEEPSLLFVQDVEKVREYFNILSQTQLSKQTVLKNYKDIFDSTGPSAGHGALCNCKGCLVAWPALDMKMSGKLPLLPIQATIPGHALQTLQLTSRLPRVYEQGLLKYHSRIYFLCPICRKAPRTLPGHLRTVCMQGRTEEDIQATVLQAKKEMAEFSHNGRFWDYHRILEIFGAANPLASLLEEMEKKGLVVRNIPPILHTPASFTHSSTRDAEREPPTVEPEEPEPASDENSEEYYQSNGPRWTDDVRVEMVKKGLYKKHSIKHHLLDGFYHYLCVDLGNRKCKQEVENVSRFMYFMNSEEPSLLFVQDVEKVREYFNILSQTQLSKQTVLKNYVGD